ncbi:MAG: helix-turn-helix domain-containing protein [Bacteriovoracaceae bacterium]|jgi:DNA-binding XRE family transcriptional regulator|nr:helix-turn-helix domain-containing protein [Bacteriovoracaceae bacterium]
MYIYYDKDLDYVEIFFEKDSNYLEPMESNEELGKFISNKDNRVIGYSIENLNSNFDELTFLSPYQKLSIIIKKYRIQMGKTQQEIADQMGIKLLPYQRLESGQNNPTLKTLLKVKEVFPDIKLDDIAA